MEENQKQIEETEIPAEEKEEEQKVEDEVFSDEDIAELRTVLAERRKGGKAEAGLPPKKKVNPETARTEERIRAVKAAVGK